MKLEGIYSGDIKIRPPEEQASKIDFNTVDGVFIKHITIPKWGSVVPQHAHAYEHETFLAVGAMAVWKDGVFDDIYQAPAAIRIAAGVKHMFVTLTDNTIICCIHNLHGEQMVKVLEEHDLMGEV